MSILKPTKNKMEEITMLFIIESENHEILGQRHLTQEETAVIQRQELDELKAMLQKSGYAIYDGSKRG